MSTVTAILDLRLKAESLAEAPAVMHAVLTQTRARPGCLQLDVLIDQDDPAHVVVYEVWESPEADAAYRAWRATPEGKSALGSVLAAPPQLTKFLTAQDI